MKASRYNFFWTLNDDVKIAFNSLTCALAQIDDEFINIIDNIKNIQYENLEEDNKKLVDEMLRGNYILTDDVDELKLVEYRMNKGKYHDYGLFLTIAPTLECNFKCPYCYEYPTSGKMSDETKAAILNWITAVAAKKGDIHVTWYGGEPLIASETIFDFSRKAIKICEESNVKYHAGMVTNGYLLNDEIIEQLIASNVNSVQITLDGPPHIHNKRRILKLNGEGTFDVLLSNIKKLKAKNILCNIRMNVDNENSSFVKDLLDILKENNLQDLPLSLGKVTSYTDACDHIAESCMHTKQFSEININTLKLLLQNRFRVNDRMLYPNIIGNYCGATQVSSYVIDPKGYIYKCWNDVGVTDKSIGNVNSSAQIEEKMKLNNVNYMTWSPLDFNECRECKYLPICMGGCPYIGMKYKKPNCENWKYQLEEYLKITYLLNND